MSQPLALSIIIPAYNESVRLERSLPQIHSHLKRQKLAAEVVIVNDGSTDDTLRIAQRFKEPLISDGIKVTILTNGRNRGKGYSVKRGVLQARGSVVVFTDADLSTPIEELGKVTDPIQRCQSDIVIGSRALDRRLIGQRQPLWRDYAGRLFNILMRIIIGLPWKDTQCGFKAYRRDVITPVFQRQRLHGFGFDVEVLYLAGKRGLRVSEVPVVWNHAEGSRVHMLRDSAHMFFDLIKIRWYQLTGTYTKPADPLPVSEA